MNVRKNAVAGTRPYKPRITCDLYVPEKGECAGLNQLLCAEREVRVLQEQKKGTGGSPCQHCGAARQGFPHQRYGGADAVAGDEKENGAGRQVMAGNEIFAKRLRQLRERKHMKRCVLAELCGMNKSMISRYERGEMEPKATALAALADFFGVTTDYLLGRDEDT